MLVFQDLTRADLAAAILAPADGPLAHVEESRRTRLANMRAKQIFNWVYQRFVWEWSGMSDLPQGLRDWLQNNVTILQLQTAYAAESADGTWKFLWNLGDKKTVESVLIPAPQEDSERLTLCISSQVGCAMACKFCLTGVQGFDRHLSAAEIVAQVANVRRDAKVTNIVFMGMGEPLHNVDNVIKACQIVCDQEGMNFSRRKVTVSTSGLVPAIEKLAANTGVMLAVSLNAPTDEQREQIMPVNKKWNIAELLAACEKFPSNSYTRVTLEYVLLRGFNDSIADAEKLHQLVQGMRVKINLIPFNEHPGSEFKRPDDETVEAFFHYLVKRRIVTTVRKSRGRDILAACGQLRSRFGTARGTDRHQDDSYRQLIGLGI